jgi:hypothetical protein
MPTNAQIPDLNRRARMYNEWTQIWVNVAVNSPQSDQDQIRQAMLDQLVSEFFIH